MSTKNPSAVALGRLPSIKCPTCHWTGEVPSNVYCPKCQGNLAPWERLIVCLCPCHKGGRCLRFPSCGCSAPLLGRAL
jgi:hypothetical protein